MCNIVEFACYNRIQEIKFSTLIMGDPSDDSQTITLLFTRAFSHSCVHFLEGIKLARYINHARVRYFSRLEAPLLFFLTENDYVKSLSY